MILGADTWLDFLSKDNSSVFLKLSINTPLNEKLTLIEKDECGATYLAESFNNKFVNHKLWICPVTLFLFGEYPSVIYYEISN